MKRDFSTALVGLGDAKLVDGEGVALTLASVAVSALMGTYQDEQGITGEEKFKRYQIAQRLSSAGTQEVTAEEVALIKRLIGKAYTPMVVGPAYIALERDPDVAPADAS